MTRAQHLVLLLADLEPGVFKDLTGCRSTVRVFVENLGQELFGAWRYMVWELDLLVANARVKLFVVSAFEREFTTKQSKQ